MRFEPSKRCLMAFAGFFARALACLTIACFQIAYAVPGRAQTPTASDAAPAKDGAANSGAPTAAAASEKKTASLTVDAARDRAQVMSDIYLATLDVMHERYFHGVRAVVPARAMEDIFAEMSRHSQVEARWISVNLDPMSVNHRPKSDFEKRAAQQIEQGKLVFEAVEGGVYRRAAAVPLGNSCINCHTGIFKEPSKSPKFAGLIISMPVVDAVGSR